MGHHQTTKTDVVEADFRKSSVKEVHLACRRMKAAIARGVNDISVKTTQKFLKIIAPVLTKISNGSIPLSYFQATWRVARVLVLIKAGEYDQPEVRACKSISLLSHLKKEVKTVINHLLKLSWRKTENCHRLKQGSD